MLEILYHAECDLPTLLQETSRWRSVFVDYHAPYVERVWCDWNEYRIYLHRIFPCAAAEALFHTHPWPSAIKVLAGRYEMAVGYGAGTTEPPVATTLVLGAGSLYEMVDQDGWHYVRPLDGPSISLMVTGKPWGRTSPKSTKPLSPLQPGTQKEILDFFRQTYH